MNKKCKKCIAHHARYCSFLGVTIPSGDEDSPPCEPSFITFLKVLLMSSFTLWLGWLTAATLLLLALVAAFYLSSDDDD